MKDHMLAVRSDVDFDQVLRRYESSDIITVVEVDRVRLGIHIRCNLNGLVEAVVDDDIAQIGEIKPR